MVAQIKEITYFTHYTIHENFLPIVVLSWWWGVHQDSNTIGITCLPGYTIQVSPSVSVQEGLCVTIPCTFTADGRKTFSNSSGYWRRMPPNTGDIVATNDKSSDVKKTNFYLRRNPDTGDCTLTITDARREDAGTYYFRFEKSKDSGVKYNYHGEATTTITVTDPAMRITWEMNGKKDNKADIIKVTEGSSVILRCSIQSPQTQLTWTDGKNSVLQQRTGKEIELRLEDITMNYTGTYTCSSKIYCGKSSTNINITVLYPPRNMEITIYSPKGRALPAGPQVHINETETLTLICRADGNPPVTMGWVRGEDCRELSKMNNSRLSTTINVTSSMADVYQCLAWNVHGLIERRIQVGTKQVPMDGHKQPRDVNVHKYVAIGFICGISITTLIILLYIFLIRKIINKKTEVTVKEMPADVDSPRDEISMNTIVPKRKPEETTDNHLQVNSGGIASNQDVLYSQINFATKRSKVPASRPETEYAEVKRK
ncbi:sialic acid-binding Ig-like lectin 14 [Dendropsophus ebraccatus]|uniref:sialic acid-binding Ig-like lectin 14 n=1 Tax=Dendropsophus ebraccatus TaxID=150705 RepID=UPI0038322CEF